MKKKEISKGMIFGHYKIIEETDRKNANRMFIVQCVCGKKRIVVLDNLLRGKAKSCGCKRGKHFKSYHSLYSIWNHMKQRCINPNNRMYRYYGGRGIMVCQEWINDFDVFYNWAVSNGYTKELTIDRENNEGNYTPENCRFVTNKVQQNNRRTNVILSINGVSKTIAEWSEETGINYDTIWARAKRYGYKNEQIISPVITN
jgi:hypothetical protein